MRFRIMHTPCSRNSVGGHIGSDQIQNFSGGFGCFGEFLPPMIYGQIYFPRIVRDVSTPIHR